MLDQGFFPDGIWTAPSDEALKNDIELSLAVGFNGARLHQKVFPERFHYWADKLGYLTWGEFAALHSRSQLLSFLEIFSQLEVMISRESFPGVLTAAAIKALVMLAVEFITIFPSIRAASTVAERRMNPFSLRVKLEQ